MEKANNKIYDILEVQLKDFFYIDVYTHILRIFIEKNKHSDDDVCIISLETILLIYFLEVETIIISLKENMFTFEKSLLIVAKILAHTYTHNNNKNNIILAISIHHFFSMYRRLLFKYKIKIM